MAQLGDRCDGRRFPFEPLRRAVELVVDEGPLADLAVARWLGVHQRQVVRAKAEGLTTYLADEWAARAHRVPYELWPDWLEVVDPEPAELFPAV